MDAESRRSLGATIKACRRELGWTQEELAERVAAHGDWTFRQCDVSRLERRVVTLPHRERLIHLSAVLGVPLGELLARSGWAGADIAFPDAEAISPTEPLIARPSAPDDSRERAIEPQRMSQLPANREALRSEEPLQASALMAGARCESGVAHCPGSSSE